MWEIKTLGRADDERARDMLEKTAWQVQPIMRKRGWKVQELCEMKPEQRDRVGDNLNMGQRVRLKLRKNNSGDWFDYDHVVLVMLHELCHNDIGPHNAKFFKLLDEITVECEELMAKGIGGSGAGFDAKGQRLGHRGGWGGIETRDPRKAAAEAAAKRAGYQAAMGPAGAENWAAGGAGAATQLGPREAAAAAAERRLRAERFARENGLMNDVVVIDDEDDDNFGGHGDGDGAGEERGTAKTAPAVSTSLGRCPCCDAFRCERDEGAEVVVLSSPRTGTRDAGKRKRTSGRRADEDDEEEEDGRGGRGGKGGNRRRRRRVCRGGARAPTGWRPTGAEVDVLAVHAGEPGTRDALRRVRAVEVRARRARRLQTHRRRRRLTLTSKFTNANDD